MSAQHAAYDFTKRKILDGSYTEGTLLSEGMVADAIGISRTPVREAFLRLEAEGLLRLYPKRGALIVPIPDGEAENVLEARLTIEAFTADRVVRAAAERREPLVRAMAGDLAEQRSIAAEADWAAFSGVDRRFHRRLVAAAGNPVLAVFYDSLRDRQIRLTMRSLFRDERRSELILREHAQIVELLRAGDEAGLRRALAAHLEGSLRALREADVTPALTAS
ncbi:MAG: GntR family transcriptional regulator [Candidatus Dormiibacterota bacterium]